MSEKKPPPLVVVFDGKSGESRYVEGDESLMIKTEDFTFSALLRVPAQAEQSPDHDGSFVVAMQVDSATGERRTAIEPISGGDRFYARDRALWRLRDEVWNNGCLNCHRRASAYVGGVCVACRGVETP